MLRIDTFQVYIILCERRVELINERCVLQSLFEADSLGHYLISERALFVLASEFRSPTRVAGCFRSNGCRVRFDWLIRLDSGRQCSTLFSAEERRVANNEHCRRLSKTIKRPFDSSADCSRLRETPISAGTLKDPKKYLQIWTLRIWKLRIWKFQIKNFKSVSSSLELEAIAGVPCSSLKFFRISNHKYSNQFFLTN